MKVFLSMVKLILLSVLIIITQYSCDYILEKQFGKYDVSNNSQARINTYKREAKLLLKASENNLDIIELCETLKQVDTQNNVTHLTKILEETHLGISKNYQAMAEDKLISVPRYTGISTEASAIRDLNSKAFIETYLKLILNKTETQIQLLGALGSVTNNIDFKVLVIKDTLKLKSNIDKIEIALNTLNNQQQEAVTNKLLL